MGTKVGLSIIERNRLVEGSCFSRQASPEQQIEKICRKGCVKTPEASVSWKQNRVVPRDGPRP